MSIASVPGTFPHQLRYRHLLIALVILSLALTLRCVLLVQRADADARFMPQAGTDHYNYAYNALGILDGTFPTTPFYYHPGPYYSFALMYALTRSDSIVILTIAIAMLDTLTCGVLIACAWLLTRKAWTGYLVGILYALYPIAIYYATMPLIAPLAAFLLALFIALVLWQQSYVRWWRTILIGLVGGLLALHRLNLAPILGLYLLLLWVDSHLALKTRLGHSLLATVVAIIVIAPITWHNFQASGGDFIPIATTGELELYMGNNRDSAGRHSNTLAMQNLDLPYYAALQRDMRAAPEHFWGLLLYKFALFWSGLEPGNNHTFDHVREISFLDALPLRFHHLVILAAFGYFSLVQDNRRLAAFFGMMIAWLCFGYVLVFALGRIRFPTVIPLLVVASYGMSALHDTLMQAPRLRWQGLRRYLIPLIPLVLLLLFVHWALFPAPKLPPERRYGQLPAETVVLNAQFDTVRLLGWRTLDQWDFVRDGWIPVHQAYTVELFWQVTEKTDIRYNFFLAYIDEGRRYDAIDMLIGAVSFPEHTTDEWEVGKIYGEIVSVRLDDDIPQARSGQIRAGVWYWDDEGLIVNVPTQSDLPNIALQTIAVFDTSQIAMASDETSPAMVFGEQIALLDYSLPPSAQAASTIDIDFEWQARQNMTRDYRLFLHLTDTDGQIVRQNDRRLLPDLSTLNWAVGYPLTSAMPLTMPDMSGNYSIYMGIYDDDGRLWLDDDSQNDSLLLGTIRVE